MATSGHPPIKVGQHWASTEASGKFIYAITRIDDYGYTQGQETETSTGKVYPITWHSDWLYDGFELIEQDGEE